MKKSKQANEKKKETKVKENTRARSTSRMNAYSWANGLNCVSLVAARECVTAKLVNYD